MLYEAASQRQKKNKTFQFQTLKTICLPLLLRLIEGPIILRLVRRGLAAAWHNKVNKELYLAYRVPHGRHNMIQSIPNSTI